MLRFPLKYQHMHINQILFTTQNSKFFTFSIIKNVTVQELPNSLIHKNVSELFIVLKSHNNHMVLQPIEGMGLTTDCQHHFHMSANRNEIPSSQFSGDVWSVCRVSQPSLAYQSGSTTKNQQPPKFLIMLGWHRSHTLV